MRPKKNTPKAAPPTPENRLDLLRRSLAGALAGLVPLCFILFFLTNTESELTAGALAVAVLQRVLMLALGAAVVAVAALFGMRLLRLMSVENERFMVRFLFGAGLGLGTIALVTLGLGALGVTGPLAAAVPLGAMFLAGIPELKRIGDALRRKDRPKSPPLAWFELFLIGVCLVALLFQLTLAFGLPLDYDSCEYHMAAPAHWFQVGRARPIEGNVFSNLPMNCEMLYLFGMNLTNDVMPGIHLGVVMNALSAVLAAGATFALARRFWSRRAALAALALFATAPAVIVFSTINVYNEMLQAFYMALAILAFFEFRETHATRWVIVSAIFAGLAGGVKYTALAFVPIVLAASVACVARATVRRRVGLVALYAAIVVGVMLPWIAWGRFYPFLRAETPEGAAEWIAGQHKVAGADEAGIFPAAVWKEVIASPYSSFPVFGFLALACVRWRDGHVRWLLAFLVLWTLFWYFCTHRVGRFWMPMLPVAAALAGRGFDAFGRKEMRIALSVVLAAALGYYVFLCSVAWSGLRAVAGSYDLVDGNDRLLEKRHELYPLVLFARTLDPDDRLMMIGEAQSLYLPPNVSYSTVFDEPVLSKTLRESRGDLRKAGVTHVFVNLAEMKRLSDTYGVNFVHPRYFRQLETKGVLREIPLPDVGLIRKGAPGTYPFVLYEVVREGGT